MKKNIKNYAIILSFLLFCTIFISLILTIIEKNTQINQKTLMIIGNSFLYCVIGISSFILGIKQKKHGLIQGIIYSLFIVILSSIFSNINNDTTSIIKLISKSMIAIFFAILGVNKKNLN